MMKIVLKEHQILLMNFDAWNNTNSSKVDPEETEFNYSNYQVINLYKEDIPLQGSEVNVKFERKIEDLIEKLRENKDGSEI